MIVPAGRFSALLNPRFQAAVTLRSLDRAIGTMLWHNLPWHRRTWLRLRGRKPATLARLAEQWNGMVPPFFRED